MSSYNKTAFILIFATKGTIHMQNIISEKRNYTINDVELNWAKLAKPVNPFGTEQWELQIATTDKAKADEWANNYLNVKQDKLDSSKYTVSLKRKAIRADQTDNTPVRVVDKAAQPFANVASIGNGSTGNVIVYQYPYETAGRKGTANSLTAVQITNLVEFTAQADFEPIVDTDSSPESAEQNQMPF
tara:strand:+ start:309 stop:869 length:561 start_codon:yes stop_codon:yes gene_type:complete